jgi:hypothetical protein
MNATEIESIEARLPTSLQSMPSPAQMERYLARIKRERNRHIAASFAALGGKLQEAARAIRKIAVACTAARLHQKTA